MFGFRGRCCLLSKIRQYSKANAAVIQSDPYVLPKSWITSQKSPREIKHATTTSKGNAGNNMNSKLPIHLIPRLEEQRPPRFDRQSVFASIEKELRRPPSERQLPDREVQRQLRAFGCTPSSKRAKATKGKLKNSLKRNILSEDSPLAAINPVKYVSLTDDSSDIVVLSKESDDSDSGAPQRPTGKSLRQIRLTQRVHAIVNDIILHKFAAHPYLGPTKIGFTRVDASSDLRSVTVYWLPHEDGNTENAKLSLERSKGAIRWLVTERLSYLRHSPRIEFVHDDLLIKKEKTDKMLDAILRQ